MLSKYTNKIIFFKIFFTLPFVIKCAWIILRRGGLYIWELTRSGRLWGLGRPVGWQSILPLTLAAYKIHHSHQEYTIIVAHTIKQNLNRITFSFWKVWCVCTPLYMFTVQCTWMVESGNFPRCSWALHCQG